MTQISRALFICFPCVVLLFSFSSSAGSRQSLLRMTKQTFVVPALSEADEEPSVKLNSFGKWTPDALAPDGTTVITISVTASDDVPEGTKVTLSFGVEVSNGSAGFTITPAEPVEENQFTFQIKAGQTKTIAAKYTVREVTGKPDVKSICDMSVPSGVVAKENPQTSSSELWIRLRR
jgi:hypothetical protein